VVPLRGGKCGGCHLKVSSEAESGSRSADPLKLGTCDQCGRVLYWDTN
jgi:predicted  nucleic acid-binding Zn-ribbon protein